MTVFFPITVALGPLLSRSPRSSPKLSSIISLQGTANESAAHLLALNPDIHALSSASLLSTALRIMMGALVNLQHHEEDLSAWILDERKVITSRYLAQVLNIPTSSARRLLAAFYRRHKSEVLATFLLTGEQHVESRSQSSAGRGVLLLPECRVKAEKDHFFTRLEGVQIFSLHAKPNLSKKESEKRNESGLGQGGAKLWMEDLAMATELLDAASDAGESFRYNKLSGISSPEIFLSTAGAYSWRSLSNANASKPSVMASTGKDMKGANRSSTGSVKGKGQAISAQNFFERDPTAKQRSFIGADKNQSGPQVLQGKAAPGKTKDKGASATKGAESLAGSEERAEGAVTGSSNSRLSTSLSPVKCRDAKVNPGPGNTPSLKGSKPKRKIAEEREQSDSAESSAGEEEFLPGEKTASDRWRDEERKAARELVERQADERQRKKGKHIPKEDAGEDGALSEDTEEEEGGETIATGKKSKGLKKRGGIPGEARKRGVKGERRKDQSGKKGGERDEEEIPEAVHIEPVSGAMDTFVQRSPSKDAPQDGKRTKRVLVQKSFMDEKGYFVTENVWEDQEVDEPAGPPPAPASAAKTRPSMSPEVTAAARRKRKAEEGDGTGTKKKETKAPATATKQKSMLSFFNKKS